MPFLLPLLVLISILSAPCFAEAPGLDAAPAGAEAPKQPLSPPPPEPPSSLSPPSLITPVPSASNDSQILEVVPTKEYIQFSELDPVPVELIQWDQNSGKFLYASKAEPPFLFLQGSLADGLELSINEKFILAKNGRFQAKIHIPLQPTCTITVKIFKPNHKIQIYRMITFWHKIPPALRFKIKEGNKIFEKALGYNTKFTTAAFLQLYSGGNPVTVVDLDAQRHAELTFRVFDPPEPEDLYDGWILTIRDSRSRVVNSVKRFGSPPPFVDWREVGGKIFTKDRFTYQMDLFKDDKIFEGIPNEFSTIEGLSLLDHPYLLKFDFEPREELGFYQFQNAAGVSYSNVYVGADVPMTFYNRFLLRLTGLFSLHSLDPDNVFTYARVGVGLRFPGAGDSAVFGRPFIYRIDVFVNLTGFTIAPRLTPNGYNHYGLLVEPHLVLWKYHYFIPWVEYGVRTDFGQQRLSYGLNYEFFVRPWSVKLGIGFAVDKMLAFDQDPTQLWSIFRAMATWTFFL